MFTRLANYSPWFTYSGVILILIGLARDARLHGQDPTLAQKEGIFTLSNAAHFLFAFGILLCVIGVGLFLLNKILEPVRSLPEPKLKNFGYAVALVFLILFSLRSFSLTLSQHHTESQKNEKGHSEKTGETPNSQPTHKSKGNFHIESGTLTEEEQEAANRLVKDVKVATARLADFSQAQSEGFEQATQYAYYGGFRLGGVSHFINKKYIRDKKVLDMPNPEGLVYLKTRNNEMILLGILYLTPESQVPKDLEKIWHFHTGLCYNATLKLVTKQNSDGSCTLGSNSIDPSIRMLHVWLFDNPEGQFAGMSRAALEAATRQLDKD